MMEFLWTRRVGGFAVGLRATFLTSDPPPAWVDGTVLDVSPPQPLRIAPAASSRLERVESRALRVWEWEGGRSA
jgi:hypothetical protein